MATPGLSSGMLIGDMDEWYADVLQNYRDAGVTVPGATSTTPGGTTPPYKFDPALVGSDIAEYYTTALAGQPGYTDILRNIEGVLGPDLKRQLAQTAAERGVGIGSYGGANDASALLRALGLTSLDLTNKGLEQYNKAYSAVPTLAPTSLFITPTDQANINQRWALAMAEIQAQDRRAREAAAAAERLARINQETSYGVTGANLAAARYAADVNRSDRDRLRSEALANLDRYWGGTGVSGTGGGAVSDRWYSGTNTEIDQPATLPAWWGQGGGSTGQGVIYSGPALTEEEEYGITEGYYTPEDIGLEYYDYEYGL